MDTPDITHSLRPATQGLDYYWPGTSIREACERYGLSPDQVVKMASNENPYGPSPMAVAAAGEALAAVGDLPLFPLRLRGAHGRAGGLRRA